jgi:hypothetical protein
LTNPNLESLPRKTWHHNTPQPPNTASSLNINDLMTDSFYSTVVQLFQANLASALGTNSSSNFLEKLNNIQIINNQNVETRSSKIFIDNKSLLPTPILPGKISMVFWDCFLFFLMRGVCGKYFSNNE